MKTLLLLSTMWLLYISDAFAINLPEKLVYDLSWLGISAGVGVQEIKREADELSIVSTVHSAKWLNPIFSVDDKTQALLHFGGESKLLRPKFYREQINEGKTHTLKEVVFDKHNLTVVTKDLLNGIIKNDSITEKTFDSLSCLYFVRSSRLVVGESIFIDIYDCKRVWNTEVKVVRREEISTPLGKFKTIVVKPLLKSEGFFARTGDVTVWLTDDSRKIPVKMTTSVKLGSITALITGGSYW